ncbi:MAG TPA: hypothetical protein VM943_09510 [Pyrinomonadaceae bacterium]|nr:hypothetical protein [Pyrinomonadaceae bacterium]
MTPERWQQIETLFQSAVARGTDERASYRWPPSSGVSAKSPALSEASRADRVCV